METRNHHRVNPSNIRYPYEHEFVCNAETDDSSNFDIVLYNEFDVANNSGRPMIFHYKVTKNGNFNLTDRNGLIDIQIPFIPVGNDIESMTTAENSLDFAKANTEKLNDVERKVKTELAVDEAMNYLQFEIAKQYLQESRKNRNPAILAQLKSLKLMQRFNWDLFLIYSQNNLKEFNEYAATHENALDSFKSLLDKLKKYEGSQQKYAKSLMGIDKYKYYLEDIQYMSPSN